MAGDHDGGDDDNNDGDDSSSKKPVACEPQNQVRDTSTSDNDSGVRLGSSSWSAVPSEKTLLEEIREVLPQSYLIFLLADLRLMSGTGRIKAKYETLLIDSDVYDRTTAAQLACNVSPQTGNTDTDTIAGLSDVVSKAPPGNTRSLSPAQIMALLLLELAEAFVDVARPKAGSIHNEEDGPTFGEFKAYRNDGKTRRTLEDSMESLLRAYARMISDDLATDVPSVRKRRESMAMYPAAVTGTGIAHSSVTARNIAGPRGQFISLMSVAEGIDEGEYEPDIDSEEEVGRKKSSFDHEDTTTDRGQREVEVEVEIEVENAGESDGVDAAANPVPLSSSAVRRNIFGSARDLNYLNQLNPLTAEYRRQMAETLKETRKNVAQGINDRVDNLLPANREANTQKEFQELANVLFDQGQSNPNVMSSLGGSYSAADMMTLMREGVQSRDDGQLQFMSKLFIEGSVSQLMAESHSRIVWMNDWYPLKDLTYAIAVDKSQKRVLVVFRGAITAADWQTISKYSLESIENPVKERFEGRKDRLRVFSGFYRYLFRRRKDTGTTKYSEIANLAHKYGMENIGEDYKLFVTGHSLGGALTMFFSFFASTEERFTNNGPVKGITFGSPYVGGHSFADTFRHQERSGKLQVVRVLNNNDPVPHLPFNFRIGRRGCLWRHDGIGVILPPIPWMRKWKPRVQYFGKEKSWIGSTFRGYSDNFFLNFPWLQPWNMARMHTLFELQDRLMYGLLQSEPGGEFDLLKQSMDQLYESLKESDFEKLRKVTKKSKIPQ